MVNLSVSEFFDKIKGAKWTNRGTTTDELDCCGLVFMYFRDVVGVDIVPNLEYLLNISDEGLYDDFSGNIEWEDSQFATINGLVLCNFQGGRAMHVGVCFDGFNVLHCDSQHGVRVNSVASMQRFSKCVFKKIKV